MSTAFIFIWVFLVQEKPTHPHIKRIEQVDLPKTSKSTCITVPQNYMTIAVGHLQAYHTSLSHHTLTRLRSTLWFGFKTLCYFCDFSYKRTYETHGI